MVSVWSKGVLLQPACFYLSAWLQREFPVFGRKLLTKWEGLHRRCWVKHAIHSWLVHSAAPQRHKGPFVFVLPRCSGGVLSQHQAASQKPARILSYTAMIKLPLPVMFLCWNVQSCRRCINNWLTAPSATTCYHSQRQTLILASVHKCLSDSLIKTPLEVNVSALRCAGRGVLISCVCGVRACLRGAGQVYAADLVVAVFLWWMDDKGACGGAEACALGLQWAQTELVYIMVLSFQVRIGNSVFSACMWWLYDVNSVFSLSVWPLRHT